VIVFVADIHLDPHDAPARAAFAAWLAARLAQAERIYILGDLFNYWYSGLEAVCADLLAALGDERVSILPGNRDFLLSNQPGLRLVEGEELPLELDGRRVILAHGHTLPEGDRGLKFLHAVVWPLLKRLDPRLPLGFKEALARHMVGASRVVRPLRAVIAPDVARRFGAELVVCGHLHHKIVTPGLIVLPAFVDGGEYLILERGEWRFSL